MSRNPMMAMAAAMMLVAATGWAEEKEMPRQDMALRLGGVVPAEKQDWDSAGKLDLQWRFWGHDRLGIGVSAGIEGWQARDEYSVVPDGYGVLATSVSGDVTLVPVGVSLLLRQPMAEYVNLVLEAGVRYVFVSSQVKAVVAYADASGEYASEDTIQTDDFVQGMVGMTLEGSLADPIRLIGTIGYQFDLTEASESYEGNSLGSTRFNGPIFCVGLSWDF